MTDTGKAATLSRFLDEQIKGFDARRKRDKDKAFWFRIAQAFASASITVLLGLDVTSLGGPAVAQEWLKAIALVISAAATILAAWDAFFDHRELWIRYATAASTLRGLRSELEYITSSSEPWSEAEVDRLFRQFQETLEAVNASWQQLRSSTPPKPVVDPMPAPPTVPPH